MIATLALSMVVTFAPQAPEVQAQQPTAKEIFQEMLSRYHAAKSVSGTVVFEPPARARAERRIVAAI